MEISRYLLRTSVTRRTFIGTAAAGLAGLLVTCGGDDDDEPAATTRPGEFGAGESGGRQPKPRAKRPRLRLSRLKQRRRFHQRHVPLRRGRAGGCTVSAAVSLS